MSNRVRIARRKRHGHTLVELIVSMAAATVLMAGLASCLFIAIRAFDGSSAAAARARAANVQTDLMDDLSEAKSFVSRTAQAVTFTVPDRNGDQVDEIMTYFWTGLPAAELTYATNGGPAVTVLEDVQDFNLTYLDRFMAGSTTALPPADPNQWGMRWQTGHNFGWETTFASTHSNTRRHIATRVTLTESGTLQSITAYFTVSPGGNSNVGFAIYDVGQSLRPQNLLANTATVKITASGWTTLSVPAVALSPGEYYLALSHEKDAVAYHYDSTGGETQIYGDNPLQSGWDDPWDYDDPGIPHRISIYATIEPD